MVSETAFEEKLLVIEQWVKTHDGLPEKIAPVVLRRYLHSVGSDLEQTKRLIEHSYSLRNKYSNIFCNRDPLDADIQKVFLVADLGISMPSLTSKNYRIIFNRLIDHDPEKFDFDKIIKTFFLAADYRFSCFDDGLPLRVNDGDIPIFDMTGFSYRHVTKLSFSTLRCYMKITQESFPVRLKQIHLINVSPVLSKVLMVLRPFMKASVRDLLNYHAPNSTTLFDHISKDLLPNDYGGSAGTMADIKKQFLKNLMNQREYLNSDTYWKVRDSNNNARKFEKVENKFDSLNID